MYRAFNVSENAFGSLSVLPEKINEARESHSSIKESVCDYIDYVVRNGAVISGARTAEKWFPMVKCDVFLSHSHADIEDALRISAILHEEFDLKVFVDSAVWGDSRDLLKNIDNEFCKKESSGRYDYQRRNQSTSHIYMMLNVALMNMIDQTECVFFYNTPNSTGKAEENIDDIDQTKSPWIYSEIHATRIMRSVPPVRFKYDRTLKSQYQAINESKKKLDISYDVPLRHMSKLGSAGVEKWRDKYLLETMSDSKRVNALDILYKQVDGNEKI